MLEMWKKHFKAHYRRIFDEIHRWDKEVILHSCGNVMRVIPEFIDLGVDVFDPVQPTALNIDEVGRCFVGKIAFCGGVDDQRLEDYSPQQVKDEVRHAIDVLGKPYGNAYIRGNLSYNDLQIFATHLPARTYLGVPKDPYFHNQKK